MRKVLVPTAFFLTACADGGAVNSPLPDQAPSTISAATAGARMDGAVDDALTRILPAFEENGSTPHTEALGQALRALSTSLSAGQAPGWQSLEAAERAIEAMRAEAAGNRGALAELEAVHRVLEHAAALSRTVREAQR